MSAITGSEAAALLGISRRMIRAPCTPAALSQAEVDTHPEPAFPPALPRQTD